jgi:hypothetical protein
MKSTDDPIHQRALEEAESIMKSFGFLCGSLAYHDVFPKEVVERLRKLEDATSLCIRTRSDRIAVGQKFSLKYEAKTRNTSQWADIQFEAIPYLHHLQEAEAGARCVYFWMNPAQNQRWAFLVGEPSVSSIILTQRYARNGLADGIEAWAKKLMPSISVQKVGITKGTDDPYLRIKASDAACLMNWEERIQSLMDQKEASR